ncbi:hypothetical protein G6011_01761 [Alternaria panax]|uniref:Zn(2)-C6 fungal-type domain-containing protein n=1 Tax=Alternaria panax TaxID=48097 RepID=A0AAD4ILB6_9PLEO|nr:hypothetical protein G6011_01761 [Alternaria panax]
MSALGAEWISDRSRDDSPEAPNSTEGHNSSSHQRTSKKRKVLSCYACRNRKMKCDRVFPVCGRCQKTGRGHECTYDPRLLEEFRSDAGAASMAPTERAADSNPPSDTPDVLQWKLRMQERRIAKLEHQLATRDRTGNPSQYEPVVAEEPKIKEELMFRGKGFKSQFNGATSIMSMISTNHELQAFTREALIIDHSIMRVKTDFKTFRDQKKKSARTKTARSSNVDFEIFAALPAKGTVDAQVALYFQTWETSYRIIHEPSFWTEYRVFWESERDKQSSVSFAVLLVLLIAITKCLIPKEDVFIGDTTADRQAAHKLIDICDGWIAVLPQDPILARTLCTSSIDILERTRQIFEIKVFRLGTGYMECWLMSAAVGMLPPPPPPTTSMPYINNADDNILSRCRKTLDCFTTLASKVLALQQDPANSLASSLRDTMGTTKETSSTTGVAESAPLTLLDGIDVNLNITSGVEDLDGSFDVLQDMQADMSGWSFPDFWAFDLGGDF